MNQNPHVTGPEKGRYVREMFDDIAPKYDLVNRVMTMGMDHLWRRGLTKSLSLTPGDKVLDLACGTGDVAKSIVKRWPGVSIVGGDPAPEMLLLAQKKVPTLQPVACVAEALPFADASFDAVTIAFGVRNFVDLEKGLREMKRVLKPDGRVAILEFAKPDRGPFQWFFRFYVRRVLPIIGGLLSRSDAYKYLPESIELFPPPDDFSALLTSVGIENVGKRHWLGGTVWLHTGRG